jgi:membrane protein YfhO
MSLLLYAATAAALLALAHRFVAPIGRGSAAILFLLPFCFTGHALLTGAAYGPVEQPYVTEPLRSMRVPLGVPESHNGLLSDLWAQMIPWRKALQYALVNRQWPLWNPFILSGSLLAASAQPAVYSPFTLLACLLPIADSITYSAAITFFIAGLGAFLFAREIGCRPSVALIASAGWMYSTPMAFYLLWALSASWAFLPVVLLGARRCVWRPGVASSALLAVALTLLLLAGHPETALHAVFIGGLYGIFELARRRREFGAAIGTAVAAGVLALLLTAIYVLPILEAAPQTMEYQYRVNVYSHRPRGVPIEQSLARIAADVFPFLHAQRWTLKHVRDLPLDNGAVGSVVLAAAMYAIIRARWSEKWFFLAIALFGMLARAGWTPLARALQQLPLFAMTLNERFCFAAAFALAVLAAIGIEEFLRRGSDRVMAVIFAAVLIAVTAGTLFLRSSGMVLLNALPDWGNFAVFGEIGCLAFAALVVTLNLPPRWIAPALLVCLLAQRWLDTGDVYPTVRHQFAYPPIPILEPLKRMHEPFRIVAHAHEFVPGTSALYELEDVRGYEAQTFERYVATYDLWCTHQPIWFNRVDDLTRPFLSFLNVRYAIVASDVPIPAGWHAVAEERGARLLENEGVLPRAFVPSRLVIGRADIDPTLAAMSEETDFRERAWIEAPMPIHERQNGAGSVSIARRRNGFRFRVTMAHDGWMVISEPAWKGWRAYIDGRRVEMQIANLAFLSLFVPAGEHVVRLVYLPHSFVVGRTISGATMAGLIVFGFVRLRRRSA